MNEQANESVTKNIHYYENKRFLIVIFYCTHIIFLFTHLHLFFNLSALQQTFFSTKDTLFIFSSQPTMLSITGALIGVLYIVFAIYFLFFINKIVVKGDFYSLEAIYASLFKLIVFLPLLTACSFLYFLFQYVQINQNNIVIHDVMAHRYQYKDIERVKPTFIIEKKNDQLHVKFEYLIVLKNNETILAKRDYVQRTWILSLHHVMDAHDISTDTTFLFHTHASSEMTKEQAKKTIQSLTSSNSDLHSLVDSTHCSFQVNEQHVSKCVLSN
jgi:hypothetical protein